MSNIEVGMVDRLDTTGSGPTDGEIAFARAYVTPGPMAPELSALVADPQAMTQREQAQARLRARDWPNLGQYRGANRQLAGSPVKAVFMGDSLTEMWQLGDVELFTDGVVCRGISGQTSAQMVLRFMADVIALKPAAVHLLAGGNDLAGNTGPSEFGDYQNNIRAMVTLALAHGIRVILGSLTPAAGFSWRPGIDPRPRIAQINAWLQALARERGLVYADYHVVLADKDGAMRPEFARDGLHPTAVGYAQMRPVVMDALRATLK
jgi:lysophospholipase L1-like esterase